MFASVSKACLYNLRETGLAQALAQRLCQMMHLNVSRAKTQWPRAGWINVTWKQPGRHTLVGWVFIYTVGEAWGAVAFSAARTEGRHLPVFQARILGAEIKWLRYSSSWEQRYRGKQQSGKEKWIKKWQWTIDYRTRKVLSRKALCCRL